VRKCKRGETADSDQLGQSTRPHSRIRANAPTPLRDFGLQHYCLITVPSSRLSTHHPPLSCPRATVSAPNGAAAASFSSISIPQPAPSFGYRYPFFITGQPL